VGNAGSAILEEGLTTMKTNDTKKTFAIPGAASTMSGKIPISPIAIFRHSTNDLNADDLAQMQQES